MRIKKWKLALAGIGVIFAFVAALALMYINNTGIDNIKLMYKLHKTDYEILRMPEFEGRDNRYLALRDSNVKELILERMNMEQWQYTGQEGSGYFFEKNGQTAIITTKIWNRNYIICTVQNNVVNLEG